MSDLLLGTTTFAPILLLASPQTRIVLLLVAAPFDGKSIAEKTTLQHTHTTLQKTPGPYRDNEQEKGAFNGGHKQQPLPFAYVRVREAYYIASFRSCVR